MKHCILCGILLSAAAIPGIAQNSSQQNIFSYKAGAFEVITLVETQRSGGIPGNLIGATQEMLDQYFPDKTSVSQTNAFLVRDGARNILIDTGLGAALFDNLKAIGVAPGAIDAVLITHMHGDHIGGLAKNGAALFPNAKVYLAVTEKDYWTKTAPNQGAINALAPYGSRVETFLPGELGARTSELLPGITPIASFGHTPGHSVFLLESDGQKLLIAGDFIHVERIQFPRPDVSVSYDTDPVAAAGSRRKILEYTAANNIPVAGMHLVYPSIGRVSASGSGYVFTHVE